MSVLQEDFKILFLFMPTVFCIIFGGAIIVFCNLVPGVGPLVQLVGDIFGCAFIGMGLIVLLLLVYGIFLKKK